MPLCRVNTIWIDMWNTPWSHPSVWRLLLTWHVGGFLLTVRDWHLRRASVDLRWRRTWWRVRSCSYNWVRGGRSRRLWHSIFIFGVVFLTFFIFINCFPLFIIISVRCPPRRPRRAGPTAPGLIAGWTARVKVFPSPDLTDRLSRQQPSTSPPPPPLRHPH